MSNKIVVAKDITEEELVDRTELEIKLILWHEKNDPNNGFLDGFERDGDHMLKAFYDGYKDNREAYMQDPNDPEESKLMDEFLNIAKKDIDGQYDYQPSGFDIVLKAINKFGL